MASNTTSEQDEPTTLSNLFSPWLGHMWSGDAYKDEDKIFEHNSVEIPRDLQEQTPEQKETLEEQHKRLEKKNTAALKKKAIKEQKAISKKIPKSVRAKSFLECEGTITPATFDPFIYLRGDEFVILNGKRRTGKSWLGRYMLFSSRRLFRCGEVFTTTRMNHFWQQNFPEVSSGIVLELPLSFFAVESHLWLQAWRYSTDYD